MCRWLEVFGMFPRPSTEVSRHINLISTTVFPTFPPLYPAITFTGRDTSIALFSLRSIEIEGEKKREKRKFI